MKVTLLVVFCIFISFGFTYDTKGSIESSIKIKDLFAQNESSQSSYQEENPISDSEESISVEEESSLNVNENSDDTAEGDNEYKKPEEAYLGMVIISGFFLIIIMGMFVVSASVVLYRIKSKRKLEIFD